MSPARFCDARSHELASDNGTGADAHDIEFSDPKVERDPEVRRTPVRMPTALDEHSGRSSHDRSHVTTRLGRSTIELLLAGCVLDGLDEGCHPSRIHTILDVPVGVEPLDRRFCHFSCLPRTLSRTSP